MIVIGNQLSSNAVVSFITKKEEEGWKKGEYLSSRYKINDENIEVVVGLGEEQFTRNVVANVCAKAVKEAKALECNTISVDVSKFIKAFGVEVLYNVVEGLRLGISSLETYKSETKKESYTISLIGLEETEEVKEIVKKAEVIAESVLLARRLVNAPANMLTPVILAEELSQMAKECGVEVEVVDEVAMKELGMNALLSVGMSSGNMPRLIVLRYMGDKDSKEITGYIGKGVTMDTGGYCLKPAKSMIGMKGDMAGAATVAATILALAKNKEKTNVVAVIPACENRISRESFVPGDIITSMAGKTIEIGNTDAEGRLLLIDAITYAIRKEGVTKVLDIATLTGAVVAAFGSVMAGVVSNNDEFYGQLEKASKVTCEHYCRLPILEEYKKMLHSKLADLSNMSNGGCGTITAGIFIGEFAEELPWIHVDIAGTSWVDSPCYEFQTNYATGASVTTLYHMQTVK